MNSFKLNKNEYYRQLIVKHYNNPENKGLLKAKNSLTFHHFTNSCVDDFFIELTYDKNTITAARFEGIGCAISTASIDMFLSIIIDKDLTFVQELLTNYQNMLQKQAMDVELLSDLIAFENVLKQPNRIKCALIISESINKILVDKDINHE